MHGFGLTNVIHSAKEKLVGHVRADVCLTIIRFRLSCARWFPRVTMVLFEHQSTASATEGQTDIFCSSQ